jgi:hypothetical protein
MLVIIRKIVEEVMGLDISSRLQKREYVLARCLYYHFAKVMTKNSLKSIGALIDRDHATVIHSLKNFKSDLKKFELMSTAYEDIKLALSMPRIKGELIEDRLRRLNYILKTQNNSLKKELIESENKRPKVLGLDMDGIPEERIQFFINNQMATFIKMERALLKQRESYEQANAKIRETKQAEREADSKEKSNGTRAEARQFAYFGSESFR